MSSDDNVTDISCQNRPELPVSLKAWHRPVISRIEIAQTLQNAGSNVPDGDSSPSS